MGNLHSVSKAFSTLGFRAEVVTDYRDLKQARGIVLPGVGSFRQAMTNLSNLNFVAPLQELAEQGIPLLGICLGMQLLADVGQEGGEVPGLGIIPGAVKRLSGTPKLPHVGWNTLKVKKPFLGLYKGHSDPHMYFTHSYALEPEDTPDVAALTEYGVSIVSAVQRGSVYGAQFHPEKSGAEGLALLKHFALEAGETR